jgi:TatD DNase family protein
MSELRTEPSTRSSLYDAHNHLQDERLEHVREKVIVDLRRENVRRMVVNGSVESDWPAVLKLAQTCPEAIPSFGYHPWYIKGRSPEWEENLVRFLDLVPSGVGEIGLDRWMKDYDLADQERVFTSQLRLAADRNLPVSIHCLKAWGKLLEILKAQPGPRCGFVLHSFGGPQEMIDPLVGLGAYFSLPGYFAHPPKTQQREAFRQVPRERLLIETDAPDQSLPAERVKYTLDDPKTGKPLNHPANLSAVYEFAAELLGEPIDKLAKQVEENFKRLFGSLERS